MTKFCLVYDLVRFWERPQLDLYLDKGKILVWFKMTTRITVTSAA